MRKASRGGIADYSGITYERLRKEGGILWPCPEEGHPGTQRLFESSFSHPDKSKNVRRPERTKGQKDVPTEEYPLILTTGRVMSHYLTGVQTRRSAALKARHFESFMEIHPKTAEKYNIGDRVLVRVESKEAASSSGANGRKPSGRIPFLYRCIGRIRKM